MLQNNLIQILLALSRKEMSYFEEFVHSPYFNKHEGVRKLVSYLSQIYPNFSQETCERTKVYAAIFDNAPHDQSKLSLLFTYAVRLLEKFLAQEIFEEKQGFQKLWLVEKLRRIKQYDIFEKKLVQTDDETVGGHATAAEKLYLLRQKTEEFAFLAHLNPKKQNPAIFAEKQELLDAFYYGEKLSDACEWSVRKKILKSNIAPFPLRNLLEEINQKEAFAEKFPRIGLFKNLLEMIQSGEETAYFDAAKQVIRFEEKLSFDDLQTAYNYLQNFCIEKINQGKDTFLRQLFQLYQQQLEKDLLLENGTLSEWHYKNIVTVGLRLGETEWTKNFLFEFKSRLLPDQAENAFTYNLAAIFYHQREFEKVLELLLKVEFTDARYNLDAKALLLRTYFELEEYEPLFSLCDAFRQYLIRNNLLAESRKSGYAVLFKLAKRAAKIKAGIGFSTDEKLKKELTKLKQDLSKGDIIFNAAWLKSKITELGNQLFTT